MGQGALKALVAVVVIAAGIYVGNYAIARWAPPSAA